MRRAVLASIGMGLVWSSTFASGPVRTPQKPFNETPALRSAKEVGYAIANAASATIVDPKNLTVVQDPKLKPPLDLPRRELWYVARSRHITRDRPIWLAVFAPRPKSAQIVGMMVVPMKDYRVGYLPGARLSGDHGSDADRIPEADRAIGVVAIHNGVFRQEHNLYTMDDGRRVGGGVIDPRIPADRHPMQEGLATAVVDDAGRVSIVRWSGEPAGSSPPQARQMGFPLILDGGVTPETSDWKRKGYSDRYDLAVRSYLAVRRGDQLAAYVYTERMTPLETAEMLLAMKFDDAMLLEIHEVVSARIDQTPSTGRTQKQRFGDFVSNSLATLAMPATWFQDPLDGVYDKDVFYYTVREGRRQQERE